jgi:hypothetical protein
VLEVEPEERGRIRERRDAAGELVVAEDEVGDGRQRGERRWDGAGDLVEAEVECGDAGVTGCGTWAASARSSDGGGAARGVRPQGSTAPGSRKR